jgi:hypothetical protein
LIHPELLNSRIVLFEDIEFLIVEPLNQQAKSGSTDFLQTVSLGLSFHEVAVESGLEDRGMVTSKF